MSLDSESAGSGPPSASGRRGGRRRRPKRKSTRILIWSLIAVLLVGGGAAAFWSHLNGNLKGVDVDSALGKNRPRGENDGSMNILLLGSDSRAGANGRYGKDQGGARADTAMVLHVDKDHKRADVVSVPRDTEVQRPRCADPQGSGSVPGSQQSMFNAAYQVGGPACTMKTVEQMSGLRLDHYMQIDFTGFKKVVDKLGGVDVTTKTAVQDEDSGLSLKPGKHTLKGEQALQLVRTRHGVGDGSDLSRIKLQQTFIKALIKQLQSGGTLGNPAKLYGLADTATQSISADDDLASTDKLLSLAQELKDIDPAHVGMNTLPVSYDPQNPERVVVMDKRAHAVWKALRDDRPVPKAATKGSVGDRDDSPVTAGS